MRRSFKIAVFTIALFGIFTLTATAQANGHSGHGFSHSMATKVMDFARPQNGSHPSQGFANSRLTFAPSRQTVANKNGWPIFIPQTKAQQAKEIHDQRVREQQNGGPIFVPLNKAQQAKEIHDQRVREQQNGGPIFVPLNKAQQAKQIHDQRVNNGGGTTFVPMPKAQQFQTLRSLPAKQQFGGWGQFGRSLAR